MHTPSAIWTVGHSNHDFDSFLGLLEPEQIEFLIDVRSFPFSRHAPHFNREAIEAGLLQTGVRYVFLGEQLGGRPGREDHYDADGHALYGPMSEEDPFREAIDRVRTGTSRHRLALLCSEGDPRHCHRRLLVGRVLTQHGIALRHILPDGTLWLEENVALPGERGQFSLLGEEEPWRSTQSVSHRRRLSTSSPA
jgi:uncharacterized protein (DUF488 family)